jgi:hypothetical protein
MRVMFGGCPKMRKGLFGLFTGLLTTAALSAAPCTPAPTTLCLNSSRFEVDVSWRDSRGRTGVGQAVSITPDTGYFWFFSEANIELVIKVLDARSINQKYWVFFGALTSVEFDLTVTDTATGAVKTYHNPLGQFASVGDTGAFEPVPPAPRHETVEVEGTSAPPASLEAVQKFIDAPPSASTAAFTPCAEGGASLYLANCRFRLEVHWKDSRGRHGAGQPVQLTNDTGYFWFFSSSNVELMVKVLDARAIGGKFWVFFGALSSVEYTINVVDTVSGALRSYQNPQGAFASVGDTSAFRGGDAITVQSDSARAVSGPISAADGGSLSVTAANGTVFTLNVPPNSLYVDETVTMTPVSSVGQFPFAGGLVAGVDIQPAGVPLLEGATLSIHTPAPVARSEETPVAWNGSGEDFYLVPPWPTSGDLRLEIFHLGGYGVARGTEAERQAQLGHEPVADGDLLSHELSPLLREARATAAVNGESDSKTTELIIRQRLEAGYQALKLRMEITNREPAVVVSLINESIQWIGEVLVATGETVDTVFPGRRDEIYLLWQTMISQALERIHQRCSQDPISFWEISPLVRVIDKHSLYSTFPELRAEVNNVFKCLTFKLRFESTIAISAGPLGTTYRVLANQMTLRGHLVGDFDLVVDGQGSINHAEARWDNLSSECSQTRLISPSTFRAEIYWRRNNEVILNYSTGTPGATLTATCPGGVITFTNIWVSLYRSFRVLNHEPGGNGGYEYLREGWSMTGRQDPWAIKVVSSTDPTGSGSTAEVTVFTLTHTPE